MFKKKALLITLGVFSYACIALVALTSTNIKQMPLSANAVCTDHSGNHYAKRDATCEATGCLEYWVCCNCHEHFLTQPLDGSWSDAGVATEVVGATDDRYIALADHRLDYEHGTIINSTTTTEGSATYTCLDCEEDVSFKILKLCSLSISGDYVSWSAVDNAENYRIYVDSSEAAFVASTVLSYKLSNLAIGDHTVEVRAETSSTDYVVNKGAELSFNVAKNAANGSKVSGFNDFYNGAAGTWSLVQDSGMEVLKLNPNASGTRAFASLYGVGGTAFDAGNYRVEMEIKLSAPYSDQQAHYGAYGEGSWFVPYHAVIDLSGCSDTAYTKVSADFTIAAAKTGMAEVNFSSTTAGSYALIKSVKWYKVVDSNAQIFQSIFPRQEVVVPSGQWASGGTIGNFGASEISVVADTTNTMALKVRKTGASNATFTIAADAANIKTLGTYAMSLDVKLGAGATNVDNIGFRNAATSTGVKHWTTDTTFDLSALSGSTDWVRLMVTFEVTDITNTGWANIDFWVFLHNDTVVSADNYVLIDNIAMNKINVTAK